MRWSSPGAESEVSSRLVEKKSEGEGTGRREKQQGGRTRRNTKSAKSRLMQISSCTPGRDISRLCRINVRDVSFSFPARRGGRESEREKEDDREDGFQNVMDRPNALYTGGIGLARIDLPCRRISLVNNAGNPCLRVLTSTFSITQSFETVCNLFNIVKLPLVVKLITRFIHSSNSVAVIIRSGYS